MDLTHLTAITKRSGKRLGQGHGSGKVKTSGRGTKGQKARRHIPIYFEGGALPLIKRLPFLRGKGRNYSLHEAPVVLNVSALNALPKDTNVDIAVLVKHGLIRADDAKRNGVKILGNGDLHTALVVTLPASKSAKEKIEAAGGNVTQL